MLCYTKLRKRKIQKKYFLYFKYKIHVLNFATFSGTSILYFILIHLFEGYFVFCINIHFDIFVRISECACVCVCVYWCAVFVVCSGVLFGVCSGVCVCVCVCVCI